MRKILLSIACAGSLFTPVQAATLAYEGADHIGTFVGARIQVPLGGKTKAKPRTALAIAPTLGRVSQGALQTNIGEGIAFNFARKPTLTVAGIRADRALGLTRSDDVKGEEGQHLTTGGWVAVGVGVAAIAGGLFFLHLVDEAEENSD